MYRKEVNAQSPLRILEKSIHGGLGKGNLGLVMARAGVGKTAFLVQIGLDDLMRERPVLHVSLEQTVEHVQSWYDALFEDMANRCNLENRESVHEFVQKNRIIAAFTDHDLWPERLEKTVAMFEEQAHFKPQAIIVDGYPWERHTQAENAAMIGAFKAYAKMLKAELWMSAQTHREATGDHPTKLTPPWDAFEKLVDVALFLEPDHDSATVRLLKDHDHEVVDNTHLSLHPDTLRLVVDDDTHGAPTLPKSSFTLLSGGARGAEAMFGECAEAWGLSEINFTFEGRNPERKRGLVRLSAEELEQGAVSPVYVVAHMHRSYPDTPLFRKTLKSIWHQVATAGEVFAVGTLLEDETVKGGTGWAVELAKHWHKPLFVFDQGNGKWFAWRDKSWQACEKPTISQRRFCGTGTRDLNDAGKEAIRDLFERSYGSSAR